MAIIKVTQDDVERFTIVTSPRHTYQSSSSGVTGSVKVIPRVSANEKETAYSSTFIDSVAVVEDKFDSTFDGLATVARTARVKGESISSAVESYFKMAADAAPRRTKTLDVERFTPTTNLSVYSTSKNNIKDMLMPYYRVTYPDAVWAYSNYHSLNFFTTSSNGYTFPTSSVLLYPNTADTRVTYPAGMHSGSYCLSGAFSFDFHINPRYQVDGIDTGHFKAGTIFHLSSSYAVSLVSGSRRDVNGNVAGFRIMLQLSHSADISPSTAVAGAYPSDLIFLSDDNSIVHNNWHHVVIRWGTIDINAGSGSFIIDGQSRGTFVVPSSSLGLSSASLSPSALCVGNYYEGSNSGLSSQDYFFAADLSKYDGVEKMTPLNAVSYEGPQSFTFRHPLKAEVHDLKMHRKYMSDAQITNASQHGHGSPGTDISFYLPPYFVQNTELRRTSAAPAVATAGARGGVMQSPYFSIGGTTDDPFNVAMAFGSAGHYINLENFVKDFATGRFARTLALTASLAVETTPSPSANEILYRDPGVAKRNLTILPCDDGNFDPNYEVLKSETLLNKFVDSSGTPRLDYINLSGLLSPSSLITFLGDPTSAKYDSLLSELTTKAAVLYGTEIETSITDSTFDRGVQRTVPLIIYQRLKDPTSDQVTIFNISNLFYGRRIQPGTFQLTDSAISGSQGLIGMTLKDDGRGGLYRADSLTPTATFNCVGNIFYDEGVVVVKNPHLYFFGKNQYEMSFRGTQNLYSTKYEIVAPAGMLNSSSNPSYLENYEQLRASERVGEDSDFVYISGLNLHDENMNVVARVRLAQPIIKRAGDKILFKVALDW